MRKKTLPSKKNETVEDKKTTLVVPLSAKATEVLSTSIDSGTRKKYNKHFTDFEQWVNTEGYSLP
ncbi:MAG: hypothetical protein WCP77_01005, partial [Roseococcus sp.]